jgi:hypothetical protein
MQLSHEEVIGVSGAFAPQFTKFMLAFISAVATRPPRPMVLQDSENGWRKSSLPGQQESENVWRNSPLPQPQAAPATREQLQEAVGWLRKQIPPTFGENNTTCEVAIYASYGMENLVDYLRSQSVIGSVASVLLRDIPHFPAVSRSGRSGEMIFGQSLLIGNTAPILFLARNALESYSCEEGVYVAQLLSLLGVQKMLHTFFACSANHLLQCDAVRIVGDATDLTTIAAVAPSAGASQYRSTPLFNSSVRLFCLLMVHWGKDVFSSLVVDLVVPFCVSLVFSSLSPSLSPALSFSCLFASLLFFLSSYLIASLALSLSSYRFALSLLSYRFSSLFSCRFPLSLLLSYRFALSVLFIVASLLWSYRFAPLSSLPLFSSLTPLPLSGG